MKTRSTISPCPIQSRHGEAAYRSTTLFCRKARHKRAILAGTILAAAPLAAHATVIFQTGFEPSEGYTNGATYNTGHNLIEQVGKNWTNVLGGNPNFAVFPYAGAQVPYTPNGAVPVIGGIPQLVTPVLNPNGGVAFTANGNQSGDEVPADFSLIASGLVEVSVDYYAGDWYDNNGGNYNSGLTLRGGAGDQGGFYTGRGSAQPSGDVNGNGAWAPQWWVRDAANTTTGLVTAGGLRGYRFNGVAGFDNLSRGYWHRLGMVYDKVSGQITQLKTQELICGGTINIMNNPVGPASQPLYIQGGANTPLVNAGLRLYNVGNGTLSGYDNLYVGSPYTWNGLSAVWTGNGGDGLWSNMLNWRNAADTGWGPGGTDADPRTSSCLFLTSSTISTVDIDFNAAPTWSNVTSKQVTLGPLSIVNVPTGGKFDGDRVMNPIGSAINITGGSWGSDIHPASNPMAGLIEISAGELNNVARWTNSAGGTLHIKGSLPTTVSSGGDFMSSSRKAGSSPTVRYTLDAGGVTPFTFTDYGGGAGETEGGPGNVKIKVGGIATYAGAAGTVLNLVNSGSLNRLGHTFSDAFEVGLVEGGLGVVSLKPDRTGVVLRVRPILWTGAGSNDNWQTAGNWNSAVTAKMLHFTGSTRLTPVNNNPAGTPFEGLQFVAGGGAFTLSGNKINLNGDIINQSSNAQTINLAMDLTAANLSIDAMRGNITISQPIGQSGGTYGIAKRGAGTLVLSGNNTYEGKTIIGDGVLSVASLNSVGGAPNSNLGRPMNAADGTIDIGATGTLGQLTYTGTGETTDRVINLAGTSGGNQGTNLAHNRPGGATLDQSGTGLLKFTSNLTATGAGNKTLLLQGSTAGTGEIAGAIVNGSGTTSLGKAGSGTWTLSGASTYTGTTYVLAGTLGLDFSGATAPVINIINNSANSSALTLGGGTLRLTGKASTNNSQRFKGLTALAGSSAIVLNANVTANPLVLTLGALTRASGGGTVDFTLPTGTQSATNGVTTSSITFLNNNVLTHIQFGTAFATVGGSDWATLSGGNIVAYSSLHSYTTTSTAGTSAANYTNFNIDANSSEGLLSDVITPNTLRFNSNAANAVTLAAGNNIIGAGGILVSSAVGGNVSTITGGTLQGSNSGKDLVVIQNNTIGGLTIDSVIANNASATSLTKSGPGTLTLGGSASNTYSGVTYANAGTLLLDKSDGNAIAGGGLTINPGATVQYTGASGDMMGTGQVNIYGTGQLDFNGKTDTIGAVTIASRGLKPASDQITTSPDVGNTTPIKNTAGGGNLTVGKLTIYPAPGATTLINTGTGTLTLDSDLRLAFTAAGTGRAQISGNLALPATRTFGIESFGATNNDLLIDALISGAGGLNKNTLDGYASIGRLTLSGANTYTGQTTIAAGVLSINSIKDVSGGASALGAPTSAADGTIVIGSGLTGTLVYTGGAQNTDRVISLAAGTGGATLDHSGTGLLKFTSSFTAPGAAASDQRKTLTLQGTTGGTGEIAGIIPDSAAGTAGQTATSVTKTGTGVWDLNGNNTFTGPLTVDDGTLNVNGTLATGLAVTVTDTANGASTKLRFGSVSQTLGSLTIGAGATVVFTSGLASGAFSGDDKGAGFAGGAAVPEPGTLGLLLVGALGMLNRRRRQA